MEQNKDEKDRDLSGLKDKAKGGILDVIEGALGEPEVKRLINRTIVRQSLESGIFLSCLLVGVLTLANAVKAAAGAGWQADAASGIALIIVGAVYVYVKLK